LIRRLGFEEERAPYDAETQRARFWTETWAEQNLYCPACGADRLKSKPHNSPAADFECASCTEEYELKSSRGVVKNKIVDGAYHSLIGRLQSSTNPSLAILRYDREALAVRDLTIVPKHFFTTSVIEARKPLGPTARRAGWIGCNILLSRIPQIGLIQLIRDGSIIDRSSVLDSWKRTAFLAKLGPESRGWLLEVLTCVLELGRSEFEIGDVYLFEDRLAALYPANANIRPKIRQQLQVLRDGGLLTFLGRGRYRLCVVTN
jgi:type II restriction enzyme